MADSATKRQWYAELLCNERNDRLVGLEINGEPGGPIHPMFVDLWTAFSVVLAAHGRNTFSAWSYVCRDSTSSDKPSLHSYPGLARDENPSEGPFRRTPLRRALKWSDKPTQAERAEDVARGLADTSYTRAEVEHLLAIRFDCEHDTPALRWGGAFGTIKDAMHWEIDHPPACVARGIRAGTVFGASGEFAPAGTSQEEQMDQTRWMKAQGALQERGFYLTKEDGQPFVVDGLPGGGTDAELRKYEESIGLTPVGVIRGAVEPTMDATTRSLLFLPQ